MEGWLKWPIACACAVVIAGGALMGAQTYSAYRDRKEKEESAASFARFQEISILASDGCRSRVEELMKLHSTAPIKSKDDVPLKLSSDLETCIKENIMYPYEKREMEDAALLGIFST